MMSFDPRIPQIYVYNEKGVRFAHTQTADIEGETPVGIYTGESGIYEISLTEDSEYDRYDAVVLTDRSTGRKVDLKHVPYSFTVDDRAMETGRFSLSLKLFPMKCSSLHSILWENDNCESLICKVAKV